MLPVVVDSFVDAVLQPQIRSRCAVLSKIHAPIKLQQLGDVSAVGEFHIHKVRLVFELHDGLEDQSPATHSQQTAGVLAVGKHPACEQRKKTHRSMRGGSRC